MVFIQFDSDPLIQELANPDPAEQSRRMYFLSDADDLRPEYNAGPIQVGSTGVSAVGEGSPNAPGVPANLQESEISTAGSDQIKAVPWYPDQIPPFDIVLAAANEYGMLSIMKILGVELMNSGYGVSVDDIVSEHSYTYIAHGMVPWTSQGMHPDMINANP